MIWLELRTNIRDYPPGWNLLESVWAPIKKSDDHSWPYWSLVKDVVKGDLIFHLTSINGQKAFIGFSTAITDGYITSEEPSNVRNARKVVPSYYRADLEDFKEFNPPILLSDFFLNNDKTLEKLFDENKIKYGADKQRLFYVVQNKKLQCLNGAYFSVFGENLSGLITSSYENERLNIPPDAITGVKISELKTRVGHQVFSHNVKKNFYFKCCFPNCLVEERTFLISGHISRWSDNENLRGKTGNGLCLCLMHDKAFEIGLFTIDENFRVVIANENIDNQPWLRDLLRNGAGQEIKPRIENPLIESIHEHWHRIGYVPPVS